MLSVYTRNDFNCLSLGAYAHEAVGVDWLLLVFGLELHEAIEKAKSIIRSVSSVVVGQEKMLQYIVAGLLAGGHVIIEGPPGTAKTLIAQGIARAVGGVFKRIQGNPDILPTDITGYHIYTIDGSTRFVQGPIFANILMFDELNRTPPRSQSALLQAMVEYRVSIDGVVYDLPRPFHVIATEIPVEEGEVGVYPLTLTLRDRFWVRCKSGYSSREEEFSIVERGDVLYDIGRIEFEKVVSLEEFVELQEFVSKIYIDKRVIKYIVDLINNIRSNEFVQFGPSPRGAIHLYRVSKALALLSGRDYVVPDDVKELAIPILAHKIILKREAVAESINPEDIVEEALKETIVPKE